MCRDKEILGHDASDRASISIVGLDRPSERLLRAASGLDRRGRIGDLVALLLDLLTEGLDLIRDSLQKYIDEGAIIILE